VKKWDESSDEIDMDEEDVESTESNDESNDGRKYF